MPRSARARSPQNDAAMGGQDAMMGWAADGKRGLALVLGQGFVDRLESALSEQLATGGS